ncbi:MAG: amidase family protein [Pseudomonadota bacterium]
MADLWKRSATEIAALVKAGDVSARAVTEDVLARLAAVNPALNAVVQEMPDEALAAADAVDIAVANGEDPGLLAGVPVTIKVNVDQAGYATTNGLRMQRDLIAKEDSPVVSNMKRAGAVIVGRTNTPAFSLRWFTRNSLHGQTLNPHDAGITPGGSSGGAASAVASGIGAIGHGSDIGGSIRYPAYACGIHGLRPTLGRIPAYNATGADRYIGAQLMAVSGPLARTMADIELSFRAMSARDYRDPWWVPAPLSLAPAPRRAALTVAPDAMAVAPEVEAALRDGARRLQDAGWDVVETECPPFREPAELQAMLWLAEMRRHGGQMIDREGDPDAIFVYHQMTDLAPDPDLNMVVDGLQRRIGLLREWEAFFEQYPVLLSPISGELPFENNGDVASPERFAEIIEAQLTQVGLPLMGLPGLAVATGMSGTRPVGVQLIAGRYREDRLIAAGTAIEAAGTAPSPVDPAG